MFILPSSWLSYTYYMCTLHTISCLVESNMANMDVILALKNRIELMQPWVSIRRVDRDQHLLMQACNLFHLLENYQMNYYQLISHLLANKSHNCITSLTILHPQQAQLITKLITAARNTMEALQERMLKT